MPSRYCGPQGWSIYPYGLNLVGARVLFGEYLKGSGGLLEYPTVHTYVVLVVTSVYYVIIINDSI